MTAAAPPRGETWCPPVFVRIAYSSVLGEGMRQCGDRLRLIARGFACLQVLSLWVLCIVFPRTHSLTRISSILSAVIGRQLAAAMLERSMFSSMT
jgi:hypothetical protein